MKGSKSDSLSGKVLALTACLVFGSLLQAKAQEAKLRSPYAFPIIIEHKQFDQNEDRQFDRFNKPKGSSAKSDKLFDQVDYVALFFLISTVYSFLIYLCYLIKGKFLKAIVFLAAYFLPLYAIFKLKHPLASLLRHLLQRNVAVEEVIDLVTIIILSPIWFFWIIWLFAGGYAVFIGGIDLVDYLGNHFRKKYIKSKVVGFSLIILGLSLLLLSLIFLDTGIWQSPLVTVSLLAYFIGAICVFIPKASESKINDILFKIMNRNKRR